MNQAAHVQIAVFLPAEQLVLLIAVFSHQAQSQPVAFSRKLTCIRFGRVYQGQVEIIVPADACLAKFDLFCAVSSDKEMAIGRCKTALTGNLFCLAA